MKTIALISCVSQKLDCRAPVKDIYISPLFKKNKEYALLRKVDLIFILSGAHGLLAFNEEIDPYDMTLNDMSMREKGRWASKVFDQIKEQIPDYKEVKFIILAGTNYRSNLEPFLPHTEIPLVGLPIGKQLQRLNLLIDELKKP